ncbi:MAG TPA: DUF4215 domain-containing protein [Candidatus Binatia bacterium]
MKSIRFASIFVALALSAATPAPAQVQSKAQQACLEKVVKSARKISGTVLKQISQCVHKGATGTLPSGQTADDCEADDIQGKIAKARSKVDAAATDFCSTPPDFGFTDPSTTSDSYENDNRALSVDAFDLDLDTALAGSAASDPSGRCSSTLPATWRKLEDSMHRAVEDCLKNGLRDGSIISNAGFAACLDAIVADTRGRIAKSVSLVQSKLVSKCPAGSLAAMFPGLTPVCSVYGDGMDAAGISTCSKGRMKCRICRIFNFAYGLARDCDLFDDGISNTSCPECGNGVLEAGEECDDSNHVSGDGCTAFCASEFCGDGVVNNNGTEQCDNGPDNSNTTPGACRTDCKLPNCGDGVTDPGEECDDGNNNDADGCTNSCTICGNGHVSGTEQCDDGNNVSGDCCSASCTFEALGSTCPGVPGGACLSPQCDGAGTCSQLPAHEGTSCDDGDECTNGSDCQSGVCTATSYVVTGAACHWAVVGNPTDGTGGSRALFLEQGASSSGDWCGDLGTWGQSSVMTGDIVLEQGDAANPAATFDATANIDGADVLTNDALVEGLSGEILPGTSVTSVPAGTIQAKTPAPTVYDTTGNDARIDQCAQAQLAISTSVAGLLDMLSADADLGPTLSTLPASATATITVVHAGGLSVIDVDNITGGTGVTLNLDGGGNSASVMILRVQNSLNTNIGWQWNLTNGLTADHLLIYGRGSGLSKCEIGQNNVGAGTIFCPDARVKLVAGTTWTGALLGGGTTAFSIDVGQNAELVHQRFTGF